MLLKSILGAFAITLASMAHVAAASGSSNKYDPYNHCGAPFCGFTSNVATAGTLVRNGTADVANDKAGEEVPKSE